MRAQIPARRRTIGGPDLSYTSRTLAYCLRGASHRDQDLYVMINAYWEPLEFTIQEGDAGSWRRAIDTSLPAPQDIAALGREPVFDGLRYVLAPRSVAVLMR